MSRKKVKQYENDDNEILQICDETPSLIERLFLGGDRASVSYRICRI